MSYINGVNLLPSTGEFTYDAIAYLGRRVTEASLTSINRYANGGPSAASGATTDYTIAIDNLQAEFPGCTTVSLVVSWFGNSTDITACQIYPSTTYIGGTFQQASGGSDVWRCSGLTQNSSGLIPIPQSSGDFIYGGTPSDQSVVRCVRDLKSRGLRVVFYPFILMTASGEPWRGRISYNGSDISGAATAAVNNFLGSAVTSQFTRDTTNLTVDYSGSATDYTFRRMILHYANLCVIAGGVDLFLIGSELRGLETIRGPAWTKAGTTGGDGRVTWDYPFVAGLIQLSDDVRSVFDGAGLTKDTTNLHNLIAYPSQALAYQGTAYVCASNYSLGDSATLDNHNFEVQGFRYGSGYGQLQYNSQDVAGSGSGYGWVDADPSLVVSDFLTNAQYGIGFPPGSIDATTLFTEGGGGNDASYQTYCRAVGLALSPALTDQEQASSILARWLQLTNTAAVWSGGLLRFIPYGDGAVTGNGITFVPNVTPIYNLGDDDFKVENNEDPLQVSRSDPYEAYNVWRLEVAERDNAYNLTTVESRDQNAIELYGMRIAPTVTAHEICDQNVGLISGQLILQRAVYVRNTYKFRLSWEYCLLDPMDLVAVSDTILGLNNAPIRITEIEEDENGFLSVTAEEFPLGAATATLYATQPVSNNPINRDVAADPVNTPVIFEPPPALAGAEAQVWIAASGGSGGVADPNWGGCNIWLSTDGASYSQIGTIVGPAPLGVLSATLANYSGINPDTADTLALNMAESGRTLTGGTLLDAQLGNTLCIVGSELVSFETATLTSANQYSLTTLYRGLYGTAISSHSSGAAFARLDSTVFKYDLPAQYVGVELYIKLQSFNVFGGGVQNLSTCTAYTYTPTGVAVDHPVAEEILLAGGSWDFGLVGGSITQQDDFGNSPMLSVEFELDFGAA
jgi:Putative phage tail protein/GTA TIM-barrel-like domain